MRRIRLMPEYSAPPLWTESGPIDPDVLGLSEELCAAIRAWAHEWEHGGGQQSTEEEFVARGRDLAERIQHELGTDVAIDYEP